jgi:sugar/nucleoside kinase (ribokinase family)
MAPGGPVTRRGVLCAGSIVVDIGKTIDAYPAVEGLAVIDSISLSTGGPGLNMAVDLRRLAEDLPIGMAGAIGDDDNGAFVLSECVRRGVDTRQVRTLPGIATSFTDAMVERSGGRRTFFHHIGANAYLDQADVDPDAAPPGAPPARILHVGAPGIHPMMDAALPDGGNGWSALLARARAAGLATNLELVTLDPRRVREVALPCLPHLDSIVINEIEAGALTGIEVVPAGPDGPVDWAALEACATGLIELGVHQLAVVHFPAGCVASAPDGRTWRQGSLILPPDRVRSTTGAGDAFAAGVVLGLHEGMPVPDCLRLGACSAAACVGHSHTSDGIPTASDCLALADRYAFRPTC